MSFSNNNHHLSMFYNLHSSLSLAVTVKTVCWISSFSSTSASYRCLSKYGGLSFLSAIPILKLNESLDWIERSIRYYKFIIYRSSLYIWWHCTYLTNRDTEFGCPPEFGLAEAAPSLASILSAYAPLVSLSNIVAVLISPVWVLILKCLSPSVPCTI